MKIYYIQYGKWTIIHIMEYFLTIFILVSIMIDVTQIKHVNIFYHPNVYKSNM